MERRTWATIRKQWPELTLAVTSPQLSWDEYPTESISRSFVTHTMVGDLQRIMTYPKQGFMIPQDIPMVNQAQKAPPKQSPEANGIRPTKRTLERQMAKERQGATPESSVKEPVMPASSEVQAPQIP